MKQFFSGIRSALVCWHLQWELRRAPRLGLYLELVRALEDCGRHGAALEVARRGCSAFPYSRSLKERLRLESRRVQALDLARLDARLRQRPNPGSFKELIGLHLEATDVDRAREVAERFVRRFPTLLSSHLSLGKVLLALFERDHLARDGEQAILEIREALRLNPASFAGRLLLAEAYYQIGATSKAAIQVLLALEITPDDPEARALYEAILVLPLEGQDERELLWRAEEEDESWANRRRGPARGRQAELVREVSQLSSMGGVSRVVFCQGPLSLQGHKGFVRQRAQAEDPLVMLARGFRQAASLSVKRMGFGAFEEATLSFQEGLVLVLAAGSTVLLATTNRHPYAQVILSECRKALARWTGRQAREQLLIPAATSRRRG